LFNLSDVPCDPAEFVFTVILGDTCGVERSTTTGGIASMSTDSTFSSMTPAIGFAAGVGAKPVEILPLENGDRLSRDEFERRYEAMPHLKKAELIDGVVYVMSMPVSAGFHGGPQADLLCWLGNYRAATPGLQVLDNSTVRLDWDNEPQPDASLRILPAYGGQSTDDGQYVGGAPELCCEIAATSASYDLHQKKEAFRRNGVCEYLVWRTKDRALDWFILRGGLYETLQPDDQGVIRSEVFPGLWLHAQSLLDGDLGAALKGLKGLASPGYAAFRARLLAAAPKL
jgi:Uma2 family endonuclease